MTETSIQTWTCKVCGGVGPEPTHLPDCNATTEDYPLYSVTGRTQATGPAPVAKATATCAICRKGIFQAGHDDTGKPYWIHVDGGYRQCEHDDLAYASPA